MKSRLILYIPLLLQACQEPETADAGQETTQNPNAVTIKLDSSKRETLMNEITKVLNEHPDGIAVSGLLMKQEKGTDNISRITILSDSGTIITIPYNPPLRSEEVHKFTRKGSEVSIKYTISSSGDTTVFFFTGTNN